MALLTCSTSSRWGNGLGYLYQPNVAYNHLFYIPFDNAKFAYHCLLKLLSYSYTKRWLFYCSYLNKVLINGRAHTKAPSLTIYVIKFLQSTTRMWLDRVIYDIILDFGGGGTIFFWNCVLCNGRVFNRLQRARCSFDSIEIILLWSLIWSLVRPEEAKHIYIYCVVVQ